VASTGGGDPPAAHALGERRALRPALFPGLAVRASLRRKSPVPLVESWLDRYRPDVGEFLEHVEEVRGETGWDESFRRRRVERISAATAASSSTGLAAFATSSSRPATLGWRSSRAGARSAARFTPTSRTNTPGNVEIVGAGMAAATEWLNALAAGRTSSPSEGASRIGARSTFRASSFTRRGSPLPPHGRAERQALLRGWSAPSYPAGRAWDEPVERARRVGRFRVAAEVNGYDQVICATGFERGYAHDPLLARLVTEHGLATAGNWIVLEPDSTVGALTNGERTLALAGVAGQWAFPAADTLMGAKYAARGFTRKVEACRSR
jgi:hypothetical protein